MEWLTNIFGTSDYLVRNPYYKFVVGVAHAAGGNYLIAEGLPMWSVLLGYIIKEVAFDLARVYRGHSSKWVRQIWADRWLVADSITDAIFLYLGAAMVAYDDTWYGRAVLVVGSAYFIVGKLSNDGRN